MTNLYDDIIRLPRHISPTHPPMAAMTRAAQFSPFAALTGYEAALAETARQTDRRVELSDDEQAELNLRLCALADRIAERPAATFTLFVPDGKKAGGAYMTRTGRVKRIDEIEQRVVLTDGSAIALADVCSISNPNQST